MTRTTTSFHLCALTVAIAALSACGGGSDTAVTTERDSDTAVTSGSAATAEECMTVASNDDDGDGDDNDNDNDNDNDSDSDSDSDEDDHDEGVDGDNDKSALIKAATSCAAPATTTATTTGTTTAPAPAPAVSSSALNGKSLYAAHCAGCHGGDPTRNINKVLKGTSAATTRGAIASNKGGMGYLGGSIGATEANDIAAYLARPGI